MRGKARSQPSMLALVSVESLVPPNHTLRRLKPLVDQALLRLSPDFDAMYDDRGRPSIPPERLLKAEVLIALYSVRSKSFRPKDDDDGDNNGFADFHGEKRSNDTHESKTDPEARLKRKGRGKEAKLCYEAHVLMENRNGLVTDFELTEASGRAEREAAVKMVGRLPKKRRRATLGADKAYDTKDFVRQCRESKVTPHVAQNQHARRRSAIDGRTTHHPGYKVSLTCRMLTEKIFGWMKTIGGFRKTRFRGRRKTAAAGAMVIATYNLLRITNLKASATA